MANNMISIKIEGDEEQLLQFALPNGDSFGGTVVNGLMDDHQFAVTDDIASLLGNPSSESLTMYKSEPMEQEEESDSITLSGEVPKVYPESHPHTVPPTTSTRSEFDDPDKPDSSSSSSSSDDDDDSSASEGDDDSSAKSEDEERDDDGSEESKEVVSGQPRKNGNERILQHFNRRKRFRNDTGRRELEQKGHEAELEKSLEHFVQDNTEDYLNRRGFRHPMTVVPATISKGIFASIILPKSARMNTITYGPQYDSNEVPEEIDRFWDFYLELKENRADLAGELKSVLVPMLLNFFQDLLSSDAPKLATKLYTTNAKRFFQEDKCQDSLNILTNLGRMISSGAFHSSEFLASIRHREFKLVFSEALFVKLKQFLALRRSPVLTHLFTSKLVIQIKEIADVHDSLLERPPPASSSSFTSITTTTTTTNEDDEEGSGVKPPTTKFTVAYSASSLKPNVPEHVPIPIPYEFSKPRLFDKVAQETSLRIKTRKRISPAQKSMYNLRNSVEANIPAISLYTLNGRPISAAVSLKGTLLAFGMSTSVINVCFTSEKDLNRFNMRRSLERAKQSKSAWRTSRKRHFGEMNLGGYQPGPGSPGHGLGLDDNDLKKAKMINPMHGHEGPVYDLMFHPTTSRLFSVGIDATLRAWDLTTFACICVYRGHSYPIWCMDITETGHMLVTGSTDSTARVWVPEKAQYVRMLAGHYLDVTCVKFHPNEAYVATGSLDKSVRLWSIGDGNLVRVFTGATSGLSAISFHDSGKYIIGGGEDSFIRIWNIAEGESLAELPCPIGSASACSRISLCRNMLAAGFEDNSVRIWNLCELFSGNQEATAREESGESSAASSDESEPEALQIPVKLSGGPQPPKCTDPDTASNCSFTEDELEPLEPNASSTAVRLPAPKIIRCDSSSILRLFYKDFGHLFTLGSKVEPAPGGSLDQDRAGRLPMFFTLPPAESEPEPGLTYIPERLRPVLVSAGITRWPIPIERVSSSEEEEESPGGVGSKGAEGGAASGNFKNTSKLEQATATQVVDMQKLSDPTPFMSGNTRTVLQLTNPIAHASP